MKKILLTGATGFIGRNLLQGLSEEFTVLGVGSKDLNLSNKSNIIDFVRDNQIDYIVHSAVANDINRAGLSEAEHLSNNLEMFFALEAASKFVEKVVYFGSGAEYDRANYMPNMLEDYLGKNIPSANDAYAFAKYVMAKVAEKSENIYDLCLFGVYGKYELWQRRFISNAICRALKGMPIVIRQNIFMDYLWIDDLAPIVSWFLRNTPQYKRYNVCTGKRIDLKALASYIKEICQVDIPIIVENETLKPEYTGCNARLLSEVETVSFTDVHIAIQKLCDYYKSVIDEIDEKLL